MTDFQGEGTFGKLSIVKGMNTGKTSETTSSGTPCKHSDTLDLYEPRVLECLQGGTEKKLQTDLHQPDYEELHLAVLLSKCTVH